MTQNYIIAFKAVSLSTCGDKKPCTLLNALRHNRRAIAAEVGVNNKSRIDPRRIKLNQTLEGHKSIDDVLAMAESIRVKSGVGTLKKDHVQAIEIMFSLPSSYKNDVIDYFAKCLDWTKSAVNLDILSFDVHLDEPERHAHCLLSPFSNSKSQAKAVRSKASVKRLTDSFFTSVAGPAGLRRQGARMVGATKQRGIAAVIARLQAIAAPELDSPLWPMTQDAITRNPLPYLEALGIDPANMDAPTPTRAIALTAPTPARTQARAIALCAPTSASVPVPTRAIALRSGSVIGDEKRPAKKQGLSCVALQQKQQVNENQLSLL